MNLAIIYAWNIIDDRWTYDRVPAFLKPLVKEQLISMGCEELVTED